MNSRSADMFQFYTTNNPQTATDAFIEGRMRQLAKQHKVLVTTARISEEKCPVCWSQKDLAGGND